MSVNLGPIKLHVEAIERWGDDDAFAYPLDPRNPYNTRACPVCGARCLRTSLMCVKCSREGRGGVCVRGHDLTDDANTRRARTGYKQCRACDALYKRESRRRARLDKETLR